MAQNVMTNMVFYANVRGVGQEGPVIYTRSKPNRAVLRKQWAMGIL